VGVEAQPIKVQHPALTIKRNLGALPHQRRFFQVAGFSPPNRYLVHNSSLSNLARGVYTRVLTVKGAPTPQPLEGEFARRLAGFRSLVVRRFNGAAPVDRNKFVEYYSGRRKTLYSNAVESLLTSGITSRDARIKAFVKAEFINFDDKPDPDPRVISPRDPRYNVEVGKFLRPVEHQIYAVIARIFGSPTVMKGYNAKQIGAIFKDKWDQFRDPVAVGLDASRFDQHVSVDALKWEHSVYDAIFNSAELRKLLSWQLFNDVRGYTKDGKLRYSTKGCRMSGDMNTALGNCLIMCALVHAYLQERGIKASLSNNGDDCVVIMERSNLLRFQSGLSKWFLEMGFNMKVEEPVDYIEGIEFCQTHPVCVDGEYIMVRNFPKAMAKDCLSLKQLDSKAVCKEWLQAVGDGGLSLTGGVPVCQEFYSSLCRAANQIGDVKRARTTSYRRKLAKVGLTGGMEWLSRGMARKYAPVAESTRFSFYLAFGTTPDQQVSLEALYRKLSFRYHFSRTDELVHLAPMFGC